jgi:hypothetical protein
VLGPLILLGAGEVVTGEVEVAEGCTCLGHHLLELLLLLVPEAVLLLALSLVARVVPVVVVVLVGVELLPLGPVGDEVGGITALEAAPRRPPPLLAESVYRAELPRQQGNLVVGTISSGISSSSCPESNTSSYPHPCHWSRSDCCSCTCWRSRTSSSWGSRR